MNSLKPGVYECNFDYPCISLRSKLLLGYPVKSKRCETYRSCFVCGSVVLSAVAVKRFQSSDFSDSPFHLPYVLTSVKSENIVVNQIISPCWNSSLISSKICVPLCWYCKEKLHLGYSWQWKDKQNRTKTSVWVLAACVRLTFGEGRTKNSESLGTKVSPLPFPLTTVQPRSPFSLHVSSDRGRGMNLSRAFTHFSC